jgi:uncharacterized protein with PIN domain
MNSKRAKVLGGVVVVAFLAVFSLGGGGRDTPAPRARVTTPAVLTVMAVPDAETADLGASLERLYADVTAREVAAYLDAVHEAELAEQARQAEAARQAARPVSRTPSAGVTVGECTGFAIPAYIIQRESGGNPSAYNPSGAYGCAQTLLSHYSSGSCRGLDPYSIDGQRACVDILSNGGTNLSPWAQTR